MNRTVAFLFMAVGMILGGEAYAQENVQPVEVIHKKMILPSARSMVKAAEKAMGAASLAANVKDTSAKAYGFTTGISEEKGSFKMGVLMADLEATVRAGEREKVTKAVGALGEGLARLGAPLPLLTAVVNLGSAVHGGVDLSAVNRASLPIIKPIIEDFVAREGKMSYMRLGEWVESTRLALMAAETDKIEAAEQFLKGYNLAGYFVEEFKEKGVPKAVFSSLQELSAIGNVKEPGKKEVKSALKALDTICGLM